MKKKSNGMNSRAIKRKLGIDQNQIANMIQDVHKLIEKDVFSKVSNDERYITFDKKQLMGELQNQVGELKKELEKVKSPTSPKMKKTPEIKINIS